MEKEQPVLAKNQLDQEAPPEEWAAALAALGGQSANPAPMPPNPAASSPAAQPVAPPEPKRRARPRSPFRYLALLLVGLICYGMIVLLSGLAWGSLAYLRQGEVNEATILPLAIFLGAVFVSAYLVTALSRGGTIYPAFLLALLVNAIPFLLAEAPPFELKNLSLKLLLSLIMAIIGFSVSKFIYIRNH